MFMDILRILVVNPIIVSINLKPVFDTTILEFHISYGWAVNVKHLAHCYQHMKILFSR